MVDGMNITDNEMIQILMEHIHPSYWSIQDFNLTLERVEKFVAPYGDNVFKFPCGMVDLFCDADGGFVDAHPHE